MPTDDDYEKDPELMAAVSGAAITMLGKELDGAVQPDDPTHRRLRQAAIEICRQAGILDVLRAISADGALRPPPTWPEADIVPVGGRVGWLTVHIRTFHPVRGVVRVGADIKIPKGAKLTQDQIGAAFERGRWMLNRRITKGE